MAIFEKTLQAKIIIDDTEKLICTIDTAQNINRHTEYVLQVQRGVCSENKWNVSRRYRDFLALHSSLQQSNIECHLPPKKLIGNMQPSFIAERQIALQNYLNEVLKHEVLALSLQVRSFLDPNNYSLDIAERAVQTVSIALRGDGRYDLKGPLADIGWRIRKHYFLVTEKESRTNCLLAYQSYGPDRYLNDKDLQVALKSLLTLNHPHIDQILAIHSLESGMYVVRRINENGTVRDMLYGTDYSKNYLSKYGNPKIRKPFTDGQISHYGCQILEALKFLLDKGIAHGHIHAGNVAIVNQKAVLLDVENLMVGVPCLYRPQLVRGHCSALEAVDVYGFGRLLYEMALAAPMEEDYCDFYPDYISEYLEYVLRLCLSRASLKHGVPTLSHLLHIPYFSRTPLNGHTGFASRPSLKFPLTLKNQLSEALAATQARLQNEQKLVRRKKRELRIQEILNSEEEMKKQKRRAKKRDSMWKSTSSLAETVRSRSASTGSSPTPPAPDLPLSSGTSSGSSRAVSAAGPPSSGAGDSRHALLAAICAFDKSRLAHATSD